MTDSLKILTMTFCLALVFPIQVWATPNWVSISASSGHTAAIMEDGSLWAWGDNRWGHLGDGTSGGWDNYSTIPARIGADYNWVFVSTGAWHNVAIRTDGSLWAWGWNQHGQLGNGTTDNSFIPIRIGTDYSWAYVSAGGSTGGGAGEFGHTVAIKADGSLWAWGGNMFGQLGNGNGGGGWGVSGTRYNVLTPTRIGTDYNWASVSTSGGAHTVAIRTDRSLWAWGDNNWAQFGDGTATSRNIPTRIGRDYDWASVSAGGNDGEGFTVAIKRDGSLWAWGRNNAGQIGDGTRTDRHAPTRIGTPTGWASVSAGNSHVVAIKADGTLWAWGYNGSGQLGNGTSGRNNYSHTPIRMGVATNWAAIATGGSHTVAATDNGYLWTWGTNMRGQLGDSTTRNRNTPIRVVTP